MTKLETLDSPDRFAQEPLLQVHTVRDLEKVLAGGLPARIAITGVLDISQPQTKFRKIFLPAGPGRSPDDREFQEIKCVTTYATRPTSSNRGLKHVAATATVRFTPQDLVQIVLEPDTVTRGKRNKYIEDFDTWLNRQYKEAQLTKSDIPESRSPKQAAMEAVREAIKAGGSIAWLGSERSEAFLDALGKPEQRYKTTTFNCPMQGPDCATEISNCLRSLTRDKHPVAIIARGGGTRSALAPFDDARMVDAIRSARERGILVVTAIGHARNFSLADAVADYQLAVPGDLRSVTNPYIQRKNKQDNDEKARLAAEIAKKDTDLKVLKSHIDEREKKHRTEQLVWIDRVNTANSEIDRLRGLCRSIFTHVLAQKYRRMIRVKTTFTVTLVALLIWQLWECINTHGTPFPTQRETPMAVGWLALFSAASLFLSIVIRERHALKRDQPHPAPNELLGKVHLARSSNSLRLAMQQFDSNVPLHES